MKCQELLFPVHVSAALQLLFWDSDDTCSVVDRGGTELTAKYMTPDVCVVKESPYV